MKTINVKHVAILAVAVVALSGFMWRPAAPGMVYIDNTKLFDGFTLKKQLEIQVKKEEQKRQSTIDSLKLEYAAFAAHADSVMLKDKHAAGLELKVRQYERYVAEQEKKLQMKNQEQVAEADKQIWQQLNAYVAEYGKTHDYDVVFGLSGNGNIMYGKEKLDKTAEVIAYVNQKYIGKK